MRVIQILTVEGCRTSFRDTNWVWKRYRFGHGEERWWSRGAQLVGVFIILSATFRRKIVFETKTGDGKYGHLKKTREELCSSGRAMKVTGEALIHFYATRASWVLRISANCLFVNYF
ncbi:MAG: hypothetical protein GY880_27115 [Planctomycetaceae bacterium]|nr:hypothetical protein [Planctomycetaceae bacterium]